MDYGIRTSHASLEWCRCRRWTCAIPIACKISGIFFREFYSFINNWKIVFECDSDSKRVENGVTSRTMIETEPGGNINASSSSGPGLLLYQLIRCCLLERRDVRRMKRPICSNALLCLLWFWLGKTYSSFDFLTVQIFSTFWSRLFKRWCNVFSWCDVIP